MSRSSSIRRSTSSSKKASWTRNPTIIHDWNAPPVISTRSHAGSSRRHSPMVREPYEAMESSIPVSVSISSSRSSSIKVVARKLTTSSSSSSSKSSVKVVARKLTTSSSSKSSVKVVARKVTSSTSSSKAKSSSSSSSSSHRNRVLVDRTIFPPSSSSSSGLSVGQVQTGHITERHFHRRRIYRQTKTVEKVHKVIAPAQFSSSSTSSGVRRFKKEHSPRVVGRRASHSHSHDGRRCHRRHASSSSTSIGELETRLRHHEMRKEFKSSSHGPRYLESSDSSRAVAMTSHKSKFCGCCGPCVCFGLCGCCGMNKRGETTVRQSGHGAHHRSSNVKRKVLSHKIGLVALKETVHQRAR